MKDDQVTELLYQALETEIGGVQVYTTAIRCDENNDLKEEWEKYLEQTKVGIVSENFRQTLGDALDHLRTGVESSGSNRSA